MIRRLTLLAGILLIGVLGAALVIYRNTRKELPRIPLTASSSMNPVSSGAISPDGKLLAYADGAGTHVKRLETAEVRTIEGSPAGWTVASWFPDSASFLVNQSHPADAPAMWVVQAAGGAPRKLLNDAFGWAVSPDGARVAFTRRDSAGGGDEIWLLSVKDGKQSRLFEPAEKCRFTRVQWSMDGGRIAYVKRDSGGQIGIETRDLNGASPAVIVSDRKFRDYCWLPGGRMVYWVEEPDGPNCEFWRASIGTDGRRDGKPRYLTSWAGACMDAATVTTAGNKLAFRASSAQETIYVGNLDSAEMMLGAPVRLTVSDGDDRPMSWQPDGGAVIFQSTRTGHWEVFRQGLDGGAAVQLTSRTGEASWPRSTFDGAWILYQVMPEVFPKGTTLVTYTGTRPIMRVPMSGGAPQQVLAAPLILSHRCAARANVCVTSEIPAGRNQLVFTAFDPVQGRGRELARFESDPKGSYSWDLSSDGTRIAIHKGREGQIDVLSLAGGAPQQIQVKNWASHQGVDWTFDAKGLFIGNKVPGGTELLYTDLQGNTRMVWRQPHGIRSSGVPSPDGRHLAMLGWVERSGMWMIEGF